MKVTELKAALAERGLDTKGNKAALVERLEGVLSQSDDSKANSNDIVEPPPPTTSKEDRNGDHNHPEEDGEGEEEGEEEEEPAVPGNEDGNTFDHQEYVRSKPAGISFGLHEPTKVKPQPRELLAPAVALESAGAGGEVTAGENTRAGAAAFFSGGEGGEAAVPLPPTTSFLEESDEEEEEGPPGVGNVELPAGIFTKVRSETAHSRLQCLTFSCSGGGRGPGPHQGGRAQHQLAEIHWAGQSGGRD